MSDSCPKFRFSEDWRKYYVSFILAPRSSLRTKTAIYLYMSDTYGKICKSSRQAYQMNGHLA